MINADCRRRKAWFVSVNSVSSPGDVVFAPDARAARAQVINGIRDAWDISFREALSLVRGARRWPERDVLLQHPHPLARMLPQSILHCVCHAYGGAGLKAGYRDHFYTSADDAEMKAALYHGLFVVVRTDKGRHGQPNMRMYALTDLGRNVAAGAVKTYPRCWE